MWCSPNHDYALNISRDEAKRIGRELTYQDFAGMRDTGIQLNGTVYLPVEPDYLPVVIGNNEQEYVHMEATNSAVVVAHSTSPSTPDHAHIAKAVRAIAESLLKIGL